MKTVGPVIGIFESATSRLNGLVLEGVPGAPVQPIVLDPPIGGALFLDSKAGLDKTGAISVSTIVNDAIAESAALNKTLVVGPGTYLCGAALRWVSGMRVRCEPGAVFMRGFYPGAGINAFVTQANLATEITDLIWEGGEIRGDASFTFSGNVIGTRMRRFRIDDLTINYYGKQGVSGRALNFVGYNGEINRLRCLNPAPYAGVGGIRLLGGEDVKVRRAEVYSGDDCFQFVPALTGLYGNLDTRRCHYEDCYGESLAAKVCTVANTDRNEAVVTPLTNEISECGFTRIRGKHFGVGVQIDVSGDTSKGIKNITFDDVCTAQLDSQVGSFPPVLVKVTDNVAADGFAGYGIDGLRFLGGEYANGYVQTLSVLDQTVYGPAVKIRRLLSIGTKWRAPRSADRTVEIQAGANIRFIGGLIEGNSTSVGVVKIGGVGKVPNDVVIESLITGVGGGDAPNPATAWGVQVFDGDGVRIHSRIEPATDYVTTDSRALQLQPSALNVAMLAADVSKLTGALKVVDLTATGEFRGFMNVGLADTDPSSQRMPAADLNWEVPLPVFTAANTVAVPAVDTLYLVPAFVQEDQFIDRIGLRVVTSGAGSSFKVGVWRSASRQPTGLPVASANTGVDTSGTGVLDATLAAPVKLKRGWYWIGFVFTGTLPATKAVAATNAYFGGALGASSSGTALPGGLTAEFAGYSAAQPFASNIAAADLTAASFTRLTSAAVPIPVWRVNNP